MKTSSTTLGWSLSFQPTAARQFGKLNKAAQARIQAFLESRVLAGNPRLHGAPLSGGLKGLWKYRVGDYRLICELKDDVLVILIIKIGHRSEVYNR
jgi:mRNA interferase RelE/StbE